MTRLNESPFEWKARHSSASVPKCHNTMNTILRRALKAEINLKEAEMAYSRDLYYVARYVHVHAYDVKACCDNWVCVHKITLHLQLCHDCTADRHANVAIFGFVSFSGGARSNLTTSHFVSPMFSLFLFVVVVSAWCNFYLLAVPMTNFKQYSVLILTERRLFTFIFVRSGLTLGYTCFSILGTSYC